MEAFLIAAGLIAAVLGVGAFGLKKINKDIDKSENAHRFDLLGKSIVYVFAFAFFTILIVYAVDYYNKHEIGENPAITANETIDTKLSYTVDSIRKDDIKVTVNALLVDKKNQLVNESYVIKFVWINTAGAKESKSISITDGSLKASTVLDLKRDDYQFYIVLYWKTNTIPSTAIDLRLKNL